MIGAQTGEVVAEGVQLEFIGPGKTQLTTQCFHTLEQLSFPNVRKDVNAPTRQTRTGLGVTVDIMDKVYETGRKCAKDFKQTMRIVFDDLLPQWNYRAVPLLT